MPATTIAIVWLAAAAGEVRVSADAAACPSADAVEANVASLIGESAEMRTAEIVDLGDHYRIVVGDSVRELVDGERRCEERARAAAVFIVLVLDQPAITRETPPVVLEAPPAIDQPAIVLEAPPAIDQPAPSVLDPPAPPAIDQPALAREGSRVVRPRARAIDPESIVEPATPAALELQLALLAALPFGERTKTTAGIAGAARGVWSPGLIGVAAGIGVAPAITLDFDATRIRMFRVPIDANLRIHHAFGAIDAAAEAGAVAAILSVAGDTPEAQKRGVRLELGFRAALSARAELGSVAPFVAAEAAVIPAPYEVISYRDGSVGRTPSIWLGLGAGLSWRVD